MKLHTKTWLAVALVVACLSATGRSQAQDAGTAATPEQAQAAPAPAANQESFRLSAGDVIELKHFYNPELNDTMQIRPDGFISLPFLGDVNVENKTVAETTQMLESAYKKYLKTPSITIQVRSFGSQKIYVGGEVPRPGAVNLVGRLTVLGAVMDAGGPTHAGSSSTVLLIRKGSDGKPLMQKLSLKKNDELTAASMTLLQPFDIVLVPESGIARVNRWVDQYIRKVIPVNMDAGFTYLVNAHFLP